MISRKDLLAALDFQEGYKGIPDKTTAPVLLMIAKTITIDDLCKMKKDHMNTIIDWWKENR